MVKDYKRQLLSVSSDSYDNCVKQMRIRLRMLLRDDISGWAERLEVSGSTIRDRWFKGSMPGADKIIRICLEANKSPNWLLMSGEGTDFYPYRDRQIHEDVEYILSTGSTELAEDLRRRIQTLHGRGKELKEIKEQLNRLEEMMRKQHGGVIGEESASTAPLPPKTRRKRAAL